MYFSWSNVLEYFSTSELLRIERPVSMEETKAVSDPKLKPCKIH